MKVWIVTDFEGCFEQGDVVAVYDSEDAAKKHVASLDSAVAWDFEVLSTFAPAPLL